MEVVAIAAIGTVRDKGLEEIIKVSIKCHGDSMRRKMTVQAFDIKYDWMYDIGT